MPGGVSILSDGTIRIGVDLAVTTLRLDLPAALWAAQGTNAKAETFIVNWLATNGYPGWGAKVISRSPANVLVTSNPSLTNWWLGGVT